jgi:fructose-1-phosphate kinase PfkB-like protein
MEDIPGENGLHNICPIQTVHTVCSQDSFLAVFTTDFATVACFLFSVVVSVITQLFRDGVDKL